MHGYRRALQALRSFNEPLYSADQLEGVPGIGKGIITKIEELIKEGTIKRFEFIDKDEKTKVLEVLEGVWGLGPRGADKLYKKGIKSIEQLRKNQHLLTDMQKIGLKYYEDFLERIPRAEVEQLLEKVKEACYSVVKNGKKLLKIEACGSYRRGKQSCGDIDVLITRNDGGSIEGIIEKAVIKLEKEGFLKERLGSLRYSHTGSEGYMGIC